MLNKIPSYLMAVLMIIGAVVFVITVTQVDDTNPSTWDYANPILYTVYVFFAICIIVAAGMSGFGLYVNPKNIKGAATGFLGLGAVLGISYAMASDSVAGYTADVTPAVSKLCGAGLYAFYILMALAIVSIVASAVVKIVK